MKIALIPLLAALASSIPAHAGVAVTEVAPWASGNSPVGADWFELTNTGSNAINLAGWSMDDDSATAGAASLLGIASIAAGESVIFIEGDGSQAARFIDTWFGGAAPAGLQIGRYSGTGVGLSTGSDAVYVFDAARTVQAFVRFGASTGGVTFDNAAGVNGAIGALSVAGAHGAFVSPNGEIGSPGVIAAAPVPEADTWAMMLAGLGLVGLLARRRA